MRKAIYFTVTIVMLLVLTVNMGCSSLTGTNTTAAKVLRESPIGTNWQIYQLELTVTAGNSLPIILELAEGDVVEGYFYVLSGDEDIDFTIKGNSQFYKSNLAGLPVGTPVSDRFSFTAAALTQGLTYTLTLTNNNAPAAKTKSTVFLEVIYPGKSPMFIPLK